MNYSPPRANSPLINYALAGLEKCWLPDHGRWSHIYHLDRRDQPNESAPESDVFYTLNVLLGLAQTDQVPPAFDLKAIFRRNVIQLVELPVPKYAFGMALWTAAELDEAIPPPLLSYVKSMLSDERRWSHFSAQDFGMILIGVTAQAKLQPDT